MLSALLHGSLERGCVNVVILPYLAGYVNGYSYIQEKNTHIYIKHNIIRIYTYFTIN